MSHRQLAIVTGGSTGIGYALAEECARNSFDLVIAADEEDVHAAAERLRQFGCSVEAVQVDLANIAGVDQLLAVVGDRAVDALLANAGRGLGKGFVEQGLDGILHVINTNITGTVYLAYHVAREMRHRGSGRILFTGSIGGLVPGAYSAVYNATKAFINSFSLALRAELKNTGVTITCLMPGATETEFFKRAGMLDTKLGQSEKDDPADVARIGFDAMMRGDGDVVSGWKNKIAAAIVNVMPVEVLAEQHGRMAQPGYPEKRGRRSAQKR
jgi:short-subunit dehydrogenase